MNNSLFQKGNIPWNKGRTNIYSKETIEKLRKAGTKSKKYWSKEESKKKQSKITSNWYKVEENKEKHKTLMKEIQSDPKYIEKLSKSLKELFKNRPEIIENQRQRMLDGQAAYMNSFIRNGKSKPENDLFILACKILPRPIHNYPIYRIGKGKRSYNVDVADDSLGIVLEYDGWYHFDCQESIDYHKKRQKELEEDGWKFLRYNIFQKFPTLDQMEKDIMELL